MAPQTIDVSQGLISFFISPGLSLSCPCTVLITCTVDISDGIYCSIPLNLLMSFSFRFRISFICFNLLTQQSLILVFMTYYTILTGFIQWIVMAHTLGIYTFIETFWAVILSFDLMCFRYQRIIECFLFSHSFSICCFSVASYSPVCLQYFALVLCNAFFGFCIFFQLLCFLYGSSMLPKCFEGIHIK